MHRKIRGFEVVDFVPTTRRWYRQGKPERCRRMVRLPKTRTLEPSLWRLRFILTTNRSGWWFFYAYSKGTLKNFIPMIKRPKGRFFHTNFAVAGAKTPTAGDATTDIKAKRRKDQP